MKQENLDKMQEITRLSIRRAEMEIETLALRVRLIRIHFAAASESFPKSVRDAMATIDDGMLTLRLRTQRFTDAVAFLETYFNLDA